MYHAFIAVSSQHKQTKTQMVSIRYLFNYHITKALRKRFYYYYGIGANGGAFNQCSVKSLDVHLKQIVEYSS